MRIAVAALCVLALTGSAEAGQLPRGVPCQDIKVIPKAYQKPPAVRWFAFSLHRAILHKKYCSSPRWDANACTFPDKRNQRWVVYIANDLSPDQVACVIQYEKAHMPPNYWGDPKKETPEVISWLAQQRHKGSLYGD